MSTDGTGSSEKKIMYVLMTFLVIAWGMEYSIAKYILSVFEPLTLLFFKYLIAVVILLVLKLKIEGRGFIKREDLLIYIICAISGDVGYFYCEYKAMTFLPVSIITIILAFVPLLSILVDRVFFGQKIGPKMLAGVFVSIVGIGMIIGVDVGSFGGEGVIGYVLAFAAVGLWNVYNFVTASLHDRYSSITLTINQIICALLLTWPIALTNLPDWSLVTPNMVVGILYLGIISTAICFIIMVRALNVLGPTVAAVFSNFMPVTSTLFGWLILKETLAPIQLVGGVVVVAAGYYVIKEKGKQSDKVLTKRRPLR